MFEEIFVLKSYVFLTCKNSFNLASCSVFRVQLRCWFNPCCYCVRYKVSHIFYFFACSFQHGVLKSKHELFGWEIQTTNGQQLWNKVSTSIFNFFVPLREEFVSSQVAACDLWSKSKYISQRLQV